MFSMVLVAIIIVLILWQKWGMNSAIDLNPAKNPDARAVSDRQDGGNSNANLETSDTFLFSCVISEDSDSEYPYCNLIIPLTGDDTGLDLSDFESIYITMEHKSTAPDTPRVFLNHHYSDPSKFATEFKMNLYELEVEDGLHTYKIDLDDFFVPFWWVCQSNDSNALVELNNIKEFMISSGAETEGREVYINLHSVQFNKKWIKQDTLYQVLLKAGIGWILLVLIGRYIILKTSNRKLHKESRNLLKTNKVLGEKAKSLKQEAITDPLTGILNRLGIQEVLDGCVKQFINDGQPFSIALVDVDYFKRINDNHGHDVGDQVLRQLGQCINKRCRQTDFAARWGGEEFIIVCKNTDTAGALKLAESLRQEISNLEFSHKEAVTVSIGIAQVDSEDIHSAIKRADIALYQAKAMGRNRVELFKEA